MALFDRHWRCKHGALLIALALSCMAHGLLFWSFKFQRPRVSVLAPAPLPVLVRLRTEQAPPLTQAPPPAEPSPEAPALATAARPSPQREDRPTAQPYFSLADLNSSPRFLRYAHAVHSANFTDAVQAPIGVRLFISKRGTVDRVEILDDKLSPEAQRWVTESFSALEFTPGERSGVPVNAQLQVDFTLEDSPATLPNAH